MLNWNDPESWACPVPGFQSVPDIFEAVGRKISPDGEWTGRERQVIRPDVIPKPAHIYKSYDGPQYAVRYVPDAAPPAAGDSVRYGAEDEIADYAAYNRHSPAAAALIGLPRSEDRNLTFSEWCRAYDASVLNLHRWEQAAGLRNKAFKLMHRSAAAGGLIFRAFDWSQGASTVLDPTVWQCTFEVARARFLRGAISPVYPNSAPPSGDDHLQIFNNTFVLEIYAENQSVINMLRNLVYERRPTSPEDMIELRAQALLDAASAHHAPQIIDRAALTAAPPPQPKRRGPKHRYDWVGAETALMELDGRDDILARIVADEAPQAEAEQYMASWFNQRGGEPAESSIRARVSALVQHRRESNAAKAGN